MKKIFALVLFSTVAVGLLLSLGCGQKSADSGEQEATAVPAFGQVATVSFEVSGMTCTACAAGIKASLTSLDGVLDADVSYESGKAEVKYDPEKVTVDTIVETIKKIGYTARRMS
jgi:copper chaperone CopZ